MLPRGDSFDMLTDHQKSVELLIRDALLDGVNVRGGSLFTWESEALAKRLWPHSKKKFLYHLEVDEADIRFRGDLNCYSAAVDAVKTGASPDEHVARYCAGQEAPAHAGDSPRIELLVTKATVVRKL